MENNYATASGARTLKARIKSAVQRHPGIWAGYWLSKQQIKRALLLRYFIYDVAQTYKSMYWNGGDISRDTLAAELLFQFHKIEKGLVMPGPRRFFGAEPATAVVSLCKRWISAGHSTDDTVFQGAIETLAAYTKRLQSVSSDQKTAVLSSVNALLESISARNPSLVTPRPLPGTYGPDSPSSFQSFAELAFARRSVREFLPRPVQAEVLMRAVEAAQLAPSACNRQPCRLVVVSDKSKKERLLSQQNGNKGFGHLAPHIAVITADEHCFFDASERHEPYIDGGLFAMSLILSLRDQGVGTCCLNWCVPPANDQAAHKLLDIPMGQRIVMLVAIGYPPPDCQVPRSPRRSTTEVLQFHN